MRREPGLKERLRRLREECSAVVGSIDEKKEMVGSFTHQSNFSFKDTKRSLAFLEWPQRKRRTRNLRVQTASGRFGLKNKFFFPFFPENKLLSRKLCFADTNREDNKRPFYTSLQNLSRDVFDETAKSETNARYFQHATRLMKQTTSIFNNNSQTASKNTASFCTISAALCSFSTSRKCHEIWKY